MLTCANSALDCQFKQRKSNSPLSRLSMNSAAWIRAAILIFNVSRVCTRITNNTRLDSIKTINKKYVCPLRSSRLRLPMSKTHWRTSRGRAMERIAVRERVRDRALSAAFGRARRGRPIAPRRAQANTWVNHVNFVFPNKTFFLCVLL